MNIPNSKSIMLPFLQYIDDSQEHRRQEIVDALAATPFELTPEQKAELMPRGMPVFVYRCDWAKTHLKKAGLIEASERGYSRITDRGLAFLEAWDNNPEEIEDAIMKSPAKFYDYVNNRWPIEDEDDDQTSEKSEGLMDFIEEIRNLSTKIKKYKDVIQNEEMTKTTFVMPFIKLLGYDVFDPTDVVPEFTADIGTKQGEKVDYAIFKDDQVIMLIECKKYGTDLSDAHTSQLFRYFTASDVKIAILTNGALYRFYTDLEKSHIMDKKPFLEFNMLDIQPQLANELNRFTKRDFNFDAIRIAASDFKYTKEIKQFLMEQLETPSEKFVQFFLSSVYSGKRTQAVVQQFSGIVSRALNQFLDEQVNQRSQSAINGEEVPEESVEVEESKEDISSKAVTQEGNREHQHKKLQREGYIEHAVGERWKIVSGDDSNIWTAERFRELISDEKHEAVYAQRRQIESLSELGADLMNFVAQNQWELTLQFKERNFGFYFGRRLVFGINLHAQISRLCIWVPEGDVIDKENDYINRGIMNHRHEKYYSSSSCAVYPRGIGVADVKEMLEFAYTWQRGELD